MTNHIENGSPAAEPALFIIFGITGNLARHRLLPALYHLLADKLLHEHTEILGISRQDVDVDQFLDSVKVCMLESGETCDPQVVTELRERLHIIRFNPVEEKAYETLRTTLDDIETTHGMCMNRLFYLAIPPQVYRPIIENLGKHDLHVGCHHRRAVSRLLVEKPFGYDLVSAQELIDHTAQYFHEAQVFRIDHYLAKETVQNILVFREQNPIFSQLWSDTYISAIDIDMFEQIGIEGRGDFYDNIGALRDVVQNHLLQLLALTTMDVPAASSDSHALHHAKETLLASIRPIAPDPAHAYRAQYAGYRANVANPHSSTETYVRLLLSIDNDTWRNTPVRIAAGKALMHKKTSITLTFASPTDPKICNKLRLRIQPNEGADVELVIKRPGFEDRREVVRMDFSYRGVLNNPEHPDAYERVLVDALRGDHSLFATDKEVLLSWRILQPVLDAWSQQGKDIPIYEVGSEGPSAMNESEQGVRIV